MRINTLTPCSPPVLLPMNGMTANGDEYAVNSKYLVKNGKPLFPIMGEFHFSRWQPESWEEALLKMKAGGIDIVATYVFWIHHEEKPGEWDFSGSRNLRLFLETCKKAGLQVWLRIGPWAHGECRNGGFPDFIAQGDFPIRENDETYLTYVERFYTKIAEQAEGMMCRDGGPVVGLQIENEYGHCGGPTDRNTGLAHMLTLKKLANSLGLVAPYYTATAWGGAYVAQGEFLPVYGGYVDAPWAQHTDEMPASENFMFIPFHNDENIGSDLNKNTETSTDKQNNGVPYLTAELGGGLQVTAHRRTYPFPQDIEAQTLCMLGSGANLLGYYMYHGGYNPDGRYSTLQESRATGYLNDLPVKSYDFQTCIRESGELMESYGRVKKFHLLIQDFQDILAPSEVFLPEILPCSPEDLETVRASIRQHPVTGEGFLFLNNHQRKRCMKSHQNLEFHIETSEGSLLLTGIDLMPGECKIIPYRLPMGRTTLLQTNASLLCKLGERYFFYTDQAPRYDFSKEAGNVETLSTWEANRAYKFGSQLLIADCALFQQNDSIYALSKRECEKISCFSAEGPKKDIAVDFHQVHADCSFEEFSPSSSLITDGYRRYRIRITAPKPCNIHELYLQLDYLGDKAEVYLNGKLAADWFTTGDLWHLALKRFGFPNELELRVYPSVNEVYYDLPVEPGCCLQKAEVLSEAISRVIVE